MVYGVLIVFWLECEDIMQVGIYIVIRSVLRFACIGQLLERDRIGVVVADLANIENVVTVGIEETLHTRQYHFRFVDPIDLPGLQCQVIGQLHAGGTVDDGERVSARIFKEIVPLKVGLISATASASL